MLKRYRATRRAHAAQVSREWRKKNPDRHKQSCRSWAEKNRDIKQLKEAEYRKKNAIKRKEYTKNWRRQNPEKVHEGTAARRKAIAQATPCWLNQQQKADIRRIYLLRIQLERETGMPHEVDHVVPLRNKYVCGLHVPWNLVAIPKAENQRKRNFLVQT